MRLPLRLSGQGQAAQSQGSTALGSSVSGRAAGFEANVQQALLVHFSWALRSLCRFKRAPMHLVYGGTFLGRRYMFLGRALGQYLGSPGVEACLDSTASCMVCVCATPWRGTGQMYCLSTIPRILVACQVGFSRVSRSRPGRSFPPRPQDQKYPNHFRS